MTISPEYAEELGRQIDELEAENECLREALAASQSAGNAAYTPAQPQPAANREKIYGILYEQLDLSTEVIAELAECGNLGDVTDAILTALAAQHSTQGK